MAVSSNIFLKLDLIDIYEKQICHYVKIVKIVLIIAYRVNFKSEKGETKS